MSITSDIIFDEVSGRSGNLGVITLNRPKALNALNQAMFSALTHQLNEWDAASHIKAVIIKANEGKAFCAGGDIRETYQRKMQNDPNLIYFFRDEYRLNHRIFHFPKPYIALLNGITMGGGVGISMHGSHCLATPDLVFAMPETGIGFFPDVGTTYLLSRLPYKIGFYLGLTGARMTYDDCYELGLIDAVIEQDKFPEVIYALADAVLDSGADTDAVISQVIQGFSQSTTTSQLLPHREQILRCFDKESVEDIMHSLNQESDEWCQQTLAILKTRSPTSLRVTLRALQSAAGTEFDDCIKTEYRLANRFLEGHDFFEGIRSVVIDKDHNPHWVPNKLADVSAEEAAKYFAPLEAELF